jgi:hypothetical protein
MRRIVVDTNVPVVANGRTDVSNGGRPPSIDCRLAAIDFLEETLATRCVLLDLAGEIQAEYRRYLSPTGQPGVGDRFYLQILMSAPARVERLDLPHRAGVYEDFPDDPALRGFDPSDRKFAAMARRGKAPIANATDTDWLHHNTALTANGITVQFVCGCDSSRWFASLHP